MNLDTWFSQEFSRVVKIEDKEEEQKQLALLVDVIEKKNEYYNYLWNYKKLLLEQDMKKRGIVFEKSEGISEVLMIKWENNFTNGLTENDKSNVFFNQYLWHVFSYEVKEALVKGKARQAFNRKRKNHVYVFFQHKKDVFYIDKAQLLKASDFDMEDDVYIVDSEMKWTYVHTHELQCGPYFTQSNASDSTRL